MVKTNKMIKELEQGTYVDTQYMEKEELDTAYKHALTSDSPTVDSCFNQVIIEHDVSPEYVEEVRTNPCRDIKQVIRDNNTHPTVRRMEKNKVMSVEELQKSTTPNQLISNITVRRSVSDRLDALEARCALYEGRLDEVEVIQASNTLHIEDLLEAVEIPKERKIENARKLKDRGYKIKDIARILGVTSRTIDRWVSDIKSV